MTIGLNRWHVKLYGINKSTVAHSLKERQRDRHRNTHSYNQTYEIKYKKTDRHTNIKTKETDKGKASSFSCISNRRIKIASDI